jgi:elongation factor Ts
MVDLDRIKQLREITNVSLAQCKKALEQSNGDLEKAQEILRKWGEDLAGKVAGRKAGQGIVEAYIHSNKKLGVLLELRCETDFVARNEDFKTLAHDLAMQVAAANPLCVTEEEIGQEILDKEKAIYQEQFAASGKPKEIMDKMIEGKLAKYKEGICLVKQPFIKDQTKKVEDIIKACIGKLGENIFVKRFVKIEI